MITDVGCAKVCGLSHFTLLTIALHIDAYPILGIVAEAMIASEHRFRVAARAAPVFKSHPARGGARAPSVPYAPSTMNWIIVEYNVVVRV